MPAEFLSQKVPRRVRILAGIALGLSLALPLLVWFGLNDGGWLMFPPAALSVSAVVMPNRVTLWVSLLGTAALGLLGMASIGMFYFPSVILLVLAVDALTRERTSASSAT